MIEEQQNDGGNVKKKSTWPVFYSVDLGYFTCEFVPGAAYGPSKEQKYSDDSGYSFCGVFDNEIDTVNHTLDLSGK